MVVAVAAIGAAIALAAGPQLDPDFDEDGRQTTDVAEGNDFASGLAIQDDDKVVLVGFNRAESGNPFSDDAAVVRYEADGDPDTGFGGDGIRLYEVEGGWEEAAAVAIDANDKLVVAGGAETLEGSGAAFTVLRLEDDGDPDPTFGEQGVATVDVNADVGSFGLDPARALAIQEDGKIVLAGSGGLDAGEDGLFQAMAITRVDGDGDLDTVFGDGGVTKVAFPGDESLSHAEGVAIDGEGRVVVVGTFHDAANNLEFAVVRLEADGDLDQTFSGNGIATTNLKAFGASAVVIDAADRPVVLGTGPDSAPGCCGVAPTMARYTTGGALDPAFGDEGIVSAEFGLGSGFGTALALEDDGDLVAAGYDTDMRVARYTSSGELISSDEAISSLPPGEDGFGQATAVGLDSSGNVVLGGTANLEESGVRFSAVRLTSLGTPRPTTRIDAVSVNSNKDKAKLSFSGNTLDPPLSFRCRLDGKPFSSCTSPKTYRNLSERRHTVRVVAIDASGAEDRTPAKETFRVR